MTRLFLLLTVATVGASGCGDDDGTPGPGPGPGVNTCFDLCALTEEATPTEGGCVSDYVNSRGYDTGHPDCLELSDAFARGVATSAQCNACYRSIAVSNDDCAGAHGACFDSPPPPTDAGGSPGDDAGPTMTTDAGPMMGDDAGPMMTTDAGPGGDVTTCTALCALVPVTSPSQGGCVSSTVMSLGYATDNIPCTILGANFTAGTATVAQCEACYASIAITDGHCAAVHDSCY